MEAHPLKKKSLWIAFGLLVVCTNVPYGVYVVYPFQLFFTWLHEICQVIMGLMLGGEAPVIKFFYDGSGIAFVRHPATPFGQSSVASAGLIGSMLAGWLLLLAERPSKFSRFLTIVLSLAFLYGFIFQASNLQNQLFLLGWGLVLGMISFWPVSRHHSLYQVAIMGIGGLILASTTYLDFQIFSMVAIGSLGFFFILLGLVLPDRPLKSLYFLIAVTCCFAPWLHMESLFLSKQYILGRPYGPSDMSLFAQVMFVAPSFIWALIFMLFGPRILFRMFRYYDKTALPKHAVLVRPPKKPKAAPAVLENQPESPVVDDNEPVPVPVLGQTPPSTAVALKPVRLDPQSLSDAHPVPALSVGQNQQPAWVQQGAAMLQGQPMQAVANIPPSYQQVPSHPEPHMAEQEHHWESQNAQAQQDYGYNAQTPVPHDHAGAYSEQPSWEPSAPTQGSNFASLQNDAMGVGPVTGMLNMPLGRAQQMALMGQNNESTDPEYALPGTSDASIPGLHGGNTPEYREFPEATARDLRPPAFLRDDDEEL